MEIEQSVKIFRALADPSRLMIIHSLISSPQYVEELSKRLNLSVSTVSFHIKKLESADLVYKVKEQYYTNLHLNRDILKLTLKEIVSFQNFHKETQEERFKTHTDKVLEVFVSNGRILRLPRQYKKRIIILEAVLSLFDIDRIYTEKEVDEQIKNVFDDHCSVRRYMIDENMMFRKRGKYTVNEKYTSGIKVPDGLFIKNNNDAVMDSREVESKGTRMKKTREEIKKEYKQSHRLMGVYRLRDLINNIDYIGISKNIDGIFNRHRFELNTGIHGVKQVQEVWNTYGEKGLSLELLDKLEPKEDPLFNYTEELKVLRDLWTEKLKKEGSNLFVLNGTMIMKNPS